MNDTKIKLALVDDHQLFRSSLQKLLELIVNCEIVITAANGKDLLDQLESIEKSKLPDIILLDMHMPIMNGLETAEILKDLWPGIKVIALSMVDSEETIIKMLRLGAKAYLVKDISTEELSEAINTVYDKGFYYTESITKYLINSLNAIDYQGRKAKAASDVTAREHEFLRLACRDLTYREIADRMSLTERTIDGYRESLFAKFKVKSRVGLAIYAITQNILSPTEL